MEIIKTVQGSAEWLAMRKQYLTASEASIMMGCSPYVKRNELLKMKATSTDQEFSDWFQVNVLDKGHEVEASARKLAESIIGEELYPATLASDDGELLASLDGADMFFSQIWEHKQWNAEKASCVSNGRVPPQDEWQVVQQLVISGAKRCLYMVSDGTSDRCVYLWVELQDGQESKLRAGWNQFCKDLEGFKPHEVDPELMPEPVKDLPALFIDLTGEVKGSNLSQYKDALLNKIAAINEDLKTDQDFANAEKMTKFLGEKETEIETVKRQALAQTHSIDELFRTVDHLKEEMRTKRLSLEKLVKKKKQQIRDNLAIAGKKEFEQFIADLNTSLNGVAMPFIALDFGGAMKNKRTVTSLQNAVDDELARAKVEATEIFDTIQNNLEIINAAENPALFPDLQQLVLKDPELTKLTVEKRVAEHQAAIDEAARKAEEEAKKKAVTETKSEPAPTEENSSAFTGNARTAINSNVEETSKRPTDAEIINALSLHFRAHDSVVIGWLLDMNLEVVSADLVSNF